MNAASGKAAAPRLACLVCSSATLSGAACRLDWLPAAALVVCMATTHLHPLDSNLLYQLCKYARVALDGGPGFTLWRHVYCCHTTLSGTYIIRHAP